LCYFYNVKQQQLKQNKFTQLIVTLHIQTHYMAHNNQTTMLIKSKEHLEGALFGAFASLVEIEQIYTIHEERDLDFTVQEAGEVYHVIITWTNGETITHKGDWHTPDAHFTQKEEMIYHYHKSTDMYKVMKDFISQLETISEQETLF